MIDSLPPIKVFSGTKSHYMAEEICRDLGCELGKMNIQYFADGEFEVSFEESIRGCEVYLVQSTFPNTDNLMELLLMIDAAKRASAASIIAVMPYFGWARQDRKDKPRVSIAAPIKYGVFLMSLTLLYKLLMSPITRCLPFRRFFFNICCWHFSRSFLERWRYKSRFASITVSLGFSPR